MELIGQLGFAPTFEGEGDVEGFASDGGGSDRGAGALAFGALDDAAESAIAHADVFDAGFGGGAAEDEFPVEPGVKPVVETSRQWAVIIVVITPNRT